MTTPQPQGFWQHAAAHPDRLAVVDTDGTETSFGDLLAAVNRLSHGLRAEGLRPGDGLALVLPNGREFLEVYLAALQIGLYVTAVNFHLTGPEIAYILGDSEVRVLVAHERFAEACVAAADQAGLGPEGRVAIGAVPGFRPLASLATGEPDDAPPDRTAGQTMLYTSGTTGRPKGVRRPLPEVDPDTAGMVAGAFAVIFKIDLERPGVHLVAGPLYHAAPLAFGAGSLQLGHTVVLMDKWSAEETLRLIERYGVTHTHMVPTMFHRLLALPDEVKEKYDLSSLQNVVHAAAPCPVDVKRRMIEWWGPIVYEYYAATEGGGTMVTPEDWLEHPGTVGRALPGAEVKILDDDGKELPPGEPGTVWMKSAVGDFEYHRDQTKTEASHRDGLFTVGDVGYLDEDGWLYLCDRKADMIISGGVNIYPAEVEAALLGHPAVGDVAVFGVPHEDRGEEVKAVVQPASGVEPGADLERELIAFCRERLAGFKCPRSVDFRSELPRLDTGKLYKRLLRDEYWAGRDRRI